jgi:hypothetical protein
MDAQRLFKSLLTRNERVAAQACDFCGLARIPEMKRSADYSDSADYLSSGVAPQRPSLAGSPFVRWRRNLGSPAISQCGWSGVRLGIDRRSGCRGG